MNAGEVLRFAVVGVAQNALNVAVFGVLVDRGVRYMLAAVAAFLAALLASFALNRHWTFGATHEHGGRQLRRYTVVFVGAVALGLAILTALVELAGWRAVPAQVAAIAVVAPASFLAQRRYAFGRGALGGRKPGGRPADGPPTPV